MFVLRFKDGRFYKESGSRYINSKKLHDYFKTFSPRTEARDNEFFTSDINEAKLYKSKQAVRSSNAYSWGGDILEVKVSITLTEEAASVCS